jgi:uncharacterized membrane protein YgcG
MATKTEERLKLMLDEYLETKQAKQHKQVMDHFYSIFWWGIVFGTMMSYMSFMPIFFGAILGYVLAKKQWMIVDIWMESWHPWIEQAQSYWLKLWKSNKH